MKVSEWLREYHVSGSVPDHPGEDPAFAFWCGWLVGAARRGETVIDMEQAREMAIKAAEFIERQAR